MSDQTLAYGLYDQNYKLLESFLKLFHEQYVKDYFCDSYHDAVAIANLKEGDILYIAFSSTGQGTFLQSYEATQHDPADFAEAERKICKDISLCAGVTVLYKFEGGKNTYTQMYEYQWRGF